jgi:4-hydroxy-tetrahydrodipicolinate synthase
MHECCKQGDVECARSLAIRLARLTAALPQDSAPASLKYGLSLLGLTQPRLRLPLVELDETSKSSVAKAIAAVLVPNQASEARGWQAASV